MCCTNLQYLKIDDDENTHLHTAIEEGNESIIELIIKQSFTLGHSSSTTFVAKKVEFLVTSMFF